MTLIQNILRKEEETSKTIGRQLMWVFGYALITVFASQLEIPQYPVPFTFQTFFVLMAGVILGPTNGALSMLIYLSFGAVGLPAFAGGSFGIDKILGPTGGYLLSFPITAFVVGHLIRLKRNYWWMIGVMVLGSGIIFSLGTVQLYATFFHKWPDAISSGFLIFSWWDTLKCIAGASLSYTYFKNIK